MIGEDKNIDILTSRPELKAVDPNTDVMTIDEAMNVLPLGSVPDAGIYTLEDALNISEIEIAPARFGAGINRAIRGGMSSVPNSLALMFGDTIIESTRRGKIEKSRGGKPGIFATPRTGVSDEINFTIGQKIKNIATQNLDAIAKREAEGQPNFGGDLMKKGEQGRDLAGDLGQGAASLGFSLFLGLASGGGAIPAVAIGLGQTGSKYEQLKRKKWSTQTARDFGLAYGIVEGGLEMVGIDEFIKMSEIPIKAGIKGLLASMGKNFSKGAAIEGIQETSQAEGELALDTLTGLKSVKNFDDFLSTQVDVIYQGALGAILGGPGGVGFTIASRNIVADNLKKSGYDGNATEAANDLIKETMVDVVDFIETNSDARSGYEKVNQYVFDQALAAVQSSSDPRFSAMDEQQKVDWASSVAKFEASQAVAESTKRGISVEDYFSSLGVKIQGADSPEPKMIDYKVEITKKWKSGKINLKTDETTAKVVDFLSSVLDSTESGGLIKSDEGEYSRLGSGNPEWFQKVAADYNYTKADVQAILEKVKSGEKLTGRQAQAFDAMLSYAQRDLNAALNPDFVSRPMQTADQWLEQSATVSPLGFYSKVEQVIQDKIPNNVSKEQLIATLKSTGVKDEEISQLGLDAIEGKMSKEELLTLVKEKQVPLEEKVLGKGEAQSYEELPRPMQRMMDDWSDGKINDATLQDMAERTGYTVSFDPLETHGGIKIYEYGTTPTKFNNYQLPGGENYREVLIKIPNKEPKTIKNSIESVKQNEYGEWVVQTTDKVKWRIPEARNRDEAISGFLDKVESGGYAPLMEVKNKNLFHSPHWDDPNVLVHYRVNDRTDSEGKKVLFVEEIQSDWHQEGRREGYSNDYSPATKNLIQRVRDLGITKPVEQISAKDILDKGQVELSQEWFRAMQNLELRKNGVPDAPFKKSWHELALKSIIQKAVEGGYDKVAWTTGEQQVERYDLSKHIDRIEYIKQPNGKYAFNALKDGSVKVGKSDLSLAQIEEYLGKDLADKISKDFGFPDSAGFKVLDGINLKVGGEGMKGFYDQILPSFANKYTKKWGGRVGESFLSSKKVKVANTGAGYEVFIGGESKGNFATKAEAIKESKRYSNIPTDKVHSLDITPSMKEAILKEGQPLFQGEKNPRGRIEFNPSEAVITLFKNADPSTLPHELAHLWLNDMFAYVRSGKASEKYLKDWKELSDWLKITPEQSMLTIDQQEQFAKGFEAYLWQGKSPSQGLVGVFENFKRWLRDVYKSVKDLGIEINPQVTAYYDKLFQIDREYLKARQMAGNKITANRFVRGWNDIISGSFVPLSTRMAKVDESLRDVLLKFEFGISESTMQDSEKIKPFLEKYSKLSKEDKAEIDLALQNRDDVKVREMIDRLGMQAEFKAVQVLLEEMHARAIKSGLEMGHLAEYFPRMVDDVEAYMNYLRGTEQWSLIQEAIDEEEKRLTEKYLEEGSPTGYTMTEEEKAVFINKLLRGYGSSQIRLDKPGNVKQRELDLLTAEMSQYYMDSSSALVNYVTGMNFAIKSREFFGMGKGNVDGSIGKYVRELVDNGVITAQQETEVKKVLDARFKERGPNAFVSEIKNWGYITTMGSPISALTQIGDLAFSLYKNGFYFTGKGIGSLFKKEKITKKDLGLDLIIQEFSEKSKSSDAVKNVFRLIGLEFMDNIGKETLINGALDRFSSQAKKQNPELMSELKRIFEEEAESVRVDLENKTPSHNVRYLLFAELTKFQPISISEMPAAYATGGNARILYMLKSYAVKQLDVFHNEVFRQMDKNPKKAIGNLLRLSLALMLMNASADVIKDLLLGRPIKLNDLVIDNIMRLFGLSKYTLYQARTDLFDAVASTILPPIPVVADGLRDLNKAIFSEDGLEFKNIKIANQIPVVGKLYYWWFGGGRKKIEDQ